MNVSDHLLILFQFKVKTGSDQFLVVTKTMFLQIKKNMNLSAQKTLPPVLHGRIPEKLPGNSQFKPLQSLPVHKVLLRIRPS